MRDMSSTSPDGGGLFDRDMYSSSAEIASSFRPGKKLSGELTMFQGLWNRIDVNYMRPLFGEPSSGPGSIVRSGSHELLVTNQEDTDHPYNENSD